MAASQESEDQRQKRYEALYAYAKAAHDTEIKRLEDVEAKAARLFPLIVLLLGAASISVKEVVAVIQTSESIAGIFVIPYIFFYIISMITLFAFLATLSTSTVQSTSIDERVIDYLTKIPI